MKIILTDLDETLLHTDKTISNRTLQILEKCRKKGMLIGFSTSRGQIRNSHFAEIVKPDIIISNGGATVICNEKMIVCNSFSLEETRTLMAKARQICGDDCEMTADTVDSLYWNRRDDKSNQYSNVSIYDDFRCFGEPALKVCVQTDDPHKAEEIASAVNKAVAIRFSDIPWYKFSSAEATKENAILRLSEHLDVPVSEMIAFGDDFSDIGMLKLCGTGVAMGNAIPEVKAVTDQITLSNNEDGVACYLEEHFL